MTEKQDVYTRVTRKIIADLERGSLTWLQPWQAGHQAGPVSRPLRASGTPYRGVNVLMLWASAMENGYSNLWLTYRQANELGGQVRKGEKGTLVVYADTFTRTETGENGEANAVEIPFMKGYTVFNAAQVDGLPGHFYATPCPSPGIWPGWRTWNASLRRPARGCATAAPWPSTAPPTTWCRCRSFRPSATRKAITPPSPMR